tara:strand:+ start:337 stop:501 length:165 start_codon:yes stop_codon:yes gene_type:complete
MKNKYITMIYDLLEIKTANDHEIELEKDYRYSWEVTLAKKQTLDGEGKVEYDFD